MGPIKQTAYDFQPSPVSFLKTTMSRPQIKRFLSYLNLHSCNDRNFQQISLHCTV